jgi:hypothetical protein
MGAMPWGYGSVPMGGRDGGVGWSIWIRDPGGEGMVFAEPSEAA